MNFTGSLVRPMLTLAMGAVMVVWALSLMTLPKKSADTAVIACAWPVSPEVLTRVKLANDTPGTLAVHRQALRQLGKKLNTLEAPVEKPVLQLVAQSR